LIIICHWGRRKGTKLFQIGEFDASGNNVKTFCGTDELNDFPYICLDLGGRALVVDSWNSRVVLLNKDLQTAPLSVQIMCKLLPTRNVLLFASITSCFSRIPNLKAEIHSQSR